MILLPRELDMVAAGKAMPSPQSRPPIPHEIVANKGEGDRAHKPQAEKTQADNAPIRNARKAEDHKQSVQPAPAGRTAQQGYGEAAFLRDSRQ